MDFIGAVNKLRLLAAAALVALLGLGWQWREHVAMDRGRAEVRAQWQAETEARHKAESAALLTAMRNNDRIAEQQNLTNQAIKKDHENEIQSIKTLAAANVGAVGRLRYTSTGTCDNSAAVSTTAEGTSTSDAATTRTESLPAEITQNLWQLMAEADIMAANCRALQSWAAANGLAP